MNMQAALDTIDGRKIYLYPEQPQMQVEVILASKGPHQSKPLYTIRMRYPRIIHGEIMTHRVFSRNARSSRAVPVKTMLNEVRNTPYVPWHWGKNQSGMQASEECDALIPYEGEGQYFSAATNEQMWLHARDTSANVAEAFMEMGYHKQNPNRLLEPFSWIDTLITATEWDNFLWLRDHADAEPHLQDLARLVHLAIKHADVQELDSGEWHLPYVTEQDWQASITAVSPPHQALTSEWLCKISAARCARISYKPFDGDASYERELERYDSLVTADRVHASPLEHQATPDTKTRMVCDYVGEMDYSDPEATWSNPDLHGNLDGWIQYRKTIPNEAKTVGVLDPNV